MQSITPIIPDHLIAGSGLRPTLDFSKAIAEFDYAPEEDVIMRLLPDFPGYAISNTGHVLSLKDGKTLVLAAQANKGGYQQVRLCCNGTIYHPYIHRLVAMAFIPNPEGKPEVNHIDGDRANNSLENLEWVTPAENQRHAIERRASEGRTLKWAPKEIREEAYLLVRSGVSTSEAARQLGLSYHQVYNLVRTRSRKEASAVAAREALH